MSDGFESLTMKMCFDGMVHLLTGGLGTFTINAEGGNYGRVQWEFTGQYHDPVDDALPVPVHETTLPVQVELARLRLDDYSAVVAVASFTQGTDVQPRPDVNSSDGYNGVRIVGRAPGSTRRRPWSPSTTSGGRMATGKRMPFQMRVGTAVGNTVWVLAPVTQYTGLPYRDRTGIRTYDAGLKVAQYAGDDEIMFAFV